MAEWYVKELSEITQVSVQTLHHYDRIGLLKPSVRLPNGYRLYAEADLLKLQQILALKYFGFKLTQIKKLLTAEVDVLDHFALQSRFLAEKAKSLEEASAALKMIISDCRSNKSIPWETIIKLIEVYRMTAELENTWAGKVLTPDELKKYAKFAQDLKTRFSADEKKMYEDAWQLIVQEVKANLKSDPNSAKARDIGKRTMAWVNSLYCNEYASLRAVIWEKGFKQGHAGDEHGLTKEGVDWLDQAIDAYYRHRIKNILNSVEELPHKQVKAEWDTLMNEMYGDQQTEKEALYEAAQKEEGISAAGKAWLKKIYG